MGKYAVITGASSGIGKEFAKLLARQGYYLVLVARRVARLEQLAKELDTDCLIIEADLKNKNDCYQLFEKVKDLNVEILINNAGFGISGNFDEIALLKEIEMITNFYHQILIQQDPLALLYKINQKIYKNKTTNQEKNKNIDNSSKITMLITIVLIIIFVLFIAGILNCI